MARDDTSNVGSTMSDRNDSILEIAWRQKGLITTVTFLVLIVALIALILIPKRFTAEARVLLSRGGSAPTTAPVSSGDEHTTFMNTQAETLRSARVLSLAIESPDLSNAHVFDNVKGDQVSYLKKKLEVIPNLNSNYITVRLADTEKETAIAILSAIVQSYVADCDSQVDNKSTDTYQHIFDDITNLNTKRDEQKAHLLQLQGNGTADTKTNVAIERLKSLSEALTDSQKVTIKAKSELDEALRTLGWTPEKYDETKLDSAAISSASNMELIRNNLSALSRQLQEARRQFVPTHPAVRNIMAQIKDLQLTQAATLRAGYRTAMDTEAALRGKYLEQEEVTKNLDSNSAEIASTNDKIKFMDSQITVLNDKLKSLQVVEAAAFNASVPDPASVDDSTAWPNTWNTLSLALLVGLLLGTVLGLVREWVSPQLGSAERIADTVGIPVLGTLPRIAGNPQEVAAVTHVRADTTDAEAFRSIRTSMLFGAGRCKTIAITSPVARDGKTTVSTNLAISLAQSGKRVLVVDSNLKDPSLDKIFEVMAGTGLTGVLSGEDLDQAIQRTAIEHLDVLTCGPKSSGGTELFNSPKFATLVKTLSDRYDHVIFDLSSVATNADSRVVAANCDLTLLVVRSEKTNRHLTMSARDGLLSVGANLLGIVVNSSPRNASSMAYGVQSKTPDATIRQPKERALPEGDGMQERTSEILRRLRAGDDSKQ